MWFVQRCVYCEGCLLLNAFVHILFTGSQLVECLENQMLIWEVFCVLDGDWLSVWHAKCWFDGCFVHWKPIGCWFEGCFVRRMPISWAFRLLNADLRNVLSTECQMVADLRFLFKFFSLDASWFLIWEVFFPLQSDWLLIWGFFCAGCWLVECLAY